jgi:hypothetical protein
MSALPPDAPRLRAILHHLDQQIADSETVARYLRLQRDAVAEALARAEGEAPRQPQPRPRQQRPAALPAFTGSRRGGEATGFVVERQPKGTAREPVRIHTGDCPRPARTHPIAGQDARAALLDPTVEACRFCRPDTELGIDLD